MVHPTFLCRSWAEVEEENTGFTLGDKFRNSSHDGRIVSALVGNRPDRLVYRHVVKFRKTF